jgi:hypothetical protein
VVSAVAAVVLATPTSAPGPSAARELRFTAQDLYGHINGGAELFLEFGFVDLLVQEYRVGKEMITCETYRMDSPAAALGIYLAKCGVEMPIPDLSARNTGNRYQLTAVKYHTFVQVNNFNGDESLLPVMASLAGDILGGIPTAEPLAIWELLPRTDLIAGSERLIRGPFALQPLYTLGEGDILQLGGELFGVVGKYDAGDEEPFTRIVVSYPDPATAEAAFAHLLTNLDAYLTLLDQDDVGLVFADYRTRYGTAQLDGRILEILVNLPERP